MKNSAPKTIFTAVSLVAAALSLTHSPSAFAETYVYRVSAPLVKSPLKAPVLGALSLPTLTLGAAPFAILPPSSDSPGEFSYRSSNTSVATISGNMVSIVGNGLTTITASQAASGTYLAGAVSAELAVGPSLVGDGVSTDGACASGKVGCVVLRREDLPAAVTLASAYGTADLHMMGADGYGGVMRATSPGLSSGKWYYETTFSAFAAYAASNGVGIYPAGAAIQSRLSYGGISFEMATPSSGTFIQIMDRDPNARLLWVNPASPLPDVGQVVGVALDLDNHQITFYAPIGVKGPYAVPAGAWVPAIQNRSGGLMMNFGQAKFKYPVPAGFNAGVW